MEKMTAAESKENAKTILQQLGGGRFVAMTGAKNFTCDGLKLMFRIGRNCKNVNYVTVAYDRGADLYNMKFENVRMSRKTYDVTRKVIAEHSGIYFDQMQEIFTADTGLYTSL